MMLLFIQKRYNDEVMFFESSKVTSKSMLWFSSNRANLLNYFTNVKCKMSDTYVRHFTRATRVSEFKLCIAITQII